ncbi:nucleotide-binding protein [Microbacterium oxydans]|uniref:nucleotide-binding protein n=1 Tax=Microbacterium oxydans TaxID=82380 RepID=UPI0024ACD53C|nr:nucleotide-binding protein [Microbacterium oxydans]
MDTARAIQLLEQQVTDARGGSPANFDEWLKKTEVVVRAVFGEDSPIHRKLDEVRYSPMIWTENTDFAPYVRSGVQEAISVLEAGIFELEIASEAAETASPATQSAAEGARSTRVFIVHGQDDARKFELAALLHNITGEQPVILHQQPNGGKVLIEKLEEHGEGVGFAVVLLTGDDFGRAKHFDSADDQLRARQNVVFEMGFFFGLIGRERVAVLYEPTVELPSDINGLVYTELDAAGGWKPKLASELDRAGIPVDWAKIAQS